MANAEMARTQAQKEADKRYAQKIQAEGKYIAFSTKLPTVEVEEINAELEKAEMSKVEFIRRAFKLLKEGKL